MSPGSWPGAAGWFPGGSLVAGAEQGAGERLVLGVLSARTPAKCEPRRTGGRSPIRSDASTVRLIISLIKEAVTPSVPATTCWTSASMVRSLAYTRSSRSRQVASGRGISTARSTRPGRSASAVSRMSARLVVSTNVTSASAPTPSIASSSENSSGFPPGV